LILRIHFFRFQLFQRIIINLRIQLFQRIINIIINNNSQNITIYEQ